MLNLVLKMLVCSFLNPMAHYQGSAGMFLQILEELRAILEMAVTEADVALAGVGQNAGRHLDDVLSSPEHSVVKVAIDGLSKW